MDTKQFEAITKKFEGRKNNTTRAIEDLEEIMDWISNVVDNITVQNRESPIHFRASNHRNNGEKWYRDSDTQPLCFEVIDGVCSLNYGPDEYGYRDIADVSDLDYINLAETAQALNELLQKLSEISDRKGIADKFEKIRKMLTS